jgi:hypothetical protein
VILSHSRPPAAERTRTVLTHACSVVVDGGGDVVEAVDLMGVDHDGSLVMLIGLNSPLATRVAEHAAPCRVHAALVSPVPGRIGSWTRSPCSVTHGWRPMSAPPWKW